EVEEVGGEERQVVLRLSRAGPVRADTSAVALCVILVLDSHRPAERGHGEAGDVACGEDIVATVDATVFVDDDAVRDGQARGLRELRSRRDTEPGDDRVR